VEVLLKNIFLILLIFLFTIVFFAFTSQGIYQENNFELKKSAIEDDNEVFQSIYDKEVLILHAYQRDYAHTKALDKGIETYFEKTALNIKLRYEYLDTKNYYNLDDLEILSELLKNKYAKDHFDGMILCDDNALNFYLSYGEEIWGETDQVVATGINSLVPYEDDLLKLTLVEEKPNVEETIKIALKQNDDKAIKNLHFIYDETATSLLMETEILKVLDDYKDLYDSVHHRSNTPDELKKIIEEGTKEDLFFFVLYSRGPDGQSYAFDEVPSYIVKNAVNPVYGLWEFYIGTGIMGGFMASSELYGDHAADLVYRGLNGENLPSFIKDRGNHQKYIFDYKIIDKYKIDYIPKEAQVIDKPISFFDKNKVMLIVFFSVVSALLIIIGLLMYAVYQKHRVQMQNKEIGSLNSKIINTQRDLITRLGDVIETRSHETASHVRRVAEISYHLGKRYGLTEEMLEILITVSPMHDVGKIGISEKILHKPGKLTKEEFDIMKFHTNIGYEILKSPSKEILKYAAHVALEHHERWDGNGYPDQKKEEEIHIFARITAVADVYDALRSDRVYKKAWSIADTVDYIKNEKGKFFEPKIAELLIEDIPKIESLRDNVEKNFQSNLKKIYTYIENINQK
jgi:HD-GYP domain-containing protein (c-di-GMP phosphodiesterase class II)